MKIRNFFKALLRLIGIRPPRPKPPKPEPEPIPPDPGPQPGWVLHANPDSVPSSVDSKWKVYSTTNPHQGRYNSIRWSSTFYQNAGCTGDNTYCAVRDQAGNLVTGYTYYALDGDSGHARLSYTQSRVWPHDMPPTVWALLYKGNRLTGAVKITDPKRDRWFQLPKVEMVREEWLLL